MGVAGGGISRIQSLLINAMCFNASASMDQSLWRHHAFFACW